MTIDALILNAGVRQSLMAVRSLGRRGLRVAAALGAPSTDAPAFSSRWCGEAIRFDAPDASDAYLALLEAWLTRTGGGARVVIPAHDGTIAMLRAHRARLERTTRLALAGEAALAVAVNKERTLAAATRVGLRVPREVVIRTMADLPAALAHIGLPAVIKPAESWVGAEGAGGGHWVGPQLVVSEDEARRGADAVTSFGVPVLFQQYLTGRREALSFIYARGQMYARFAQWAARTRPPLGGESVLRQSIPIPADIGPGAEALVREIDLEGYCEVEFRRDAAGEPFLMEINPRLSASVEVAIRAGVDFPYLLYLWANGDPIPAVTRYRVGGWMRNLGADIDTSLLALSQRGRPGIPSPVRVAADFGLSFFRPSGYDYFWWTDPGPAIAATSRFLGELVGRLTSRARRMFR